MRLLNLILGDIKFQLKYGFYFIYFTLTIVYIGLIFAIPYSFRTTTATILIFSDPAAMGIFFMGAIILLEKSQHVLNSIAVSPVKAEEYILSKVLSLGLISTLVGLLIALASKTINILPVLLGTFLGSALFTLLGLIIAAKTNSLNQFIIATVPFELVCFLPPLLYLLGYNKNFMLIHPGCILIRFIRGDSSHMLVLIFILCLWLVLIYTMTYRAIKKMFQSVGGVQL